ncbi:uncharacterized protein B0P05DRAFT_533442 [Gilbertella persicaria]|uniref:uncharacterized protein n=1 Tax=Gilbertella persicaria TaxID=101096 RepID=UPI00222087F8|nr:uncharacterized protein B0P05DRAFT_533442 [Gilbertella persicaria]KAI8087035.1 hypothetical protein B0P05DRAFT_533442 [Gilbertella persicaria]
MLYQYFILLLFYTFLAFGKEISFQDPNIHYVGRWHESSNEIQSGWPGAYFKVILEHTRIVKLQLSKPTSLLVQLNKKHQVAFRNTTKLIDLFPSGLDHDGPHELWVVATDIDPYDMSICLQSIIVDDQGMTASPPPSTTAPLVEFVGHDLTLGLETSQNLFSSYAWLTSDLLGLEHSHIAYKDATLIDGMDNKYFDWSLLSHTDTENKVAPWSVVVLLGANDHQTEYTPEEYQHALGAFLNKVRKTMSENAPIFILSEPLGDMFRPSQEAVLKMAHQQGDQHIYFIDTTSWLRYGPNHYKDSRHLTDAGHALLAKKLAPLLQTKLMHPRDPLPGPPPNPNLPGDWQTMDVGEEDRIGLPGTVSADSDSIFTLWGSGADIDNDKDAFRFVYQPLGIQGMMEATVRSHSAFAKCAKAGIMIREHLGHGSPLIMLGISPAEGIFVQVRYDNFQSTKLIKKMRASPPYRLRLIRQKFKDTFEAQTQQVESGPWETFAVVPLVLARDIYAGLAVTSCDPSVVSVAKFTDVGLYHSAFQPQLIQQSI